MAGSAWPSAGPMTCPRGQVLRLAGSRTCLAPVLLGAAALSNEGVDRAARHRRQRSSDCLPWRRRRMGGAAIADSRAAALLCQEGTVPPPQSKWLRRSPAGPPRRRAAAAAVVICQGRGARVGGGGGELQDNMAPAAQRYKARQEKGDQLNTRGLCHCTAGPGRAEAVCDTRAMRL